MMMGYTMVTLVGQSAVKLRRLVAVHEAGHAAVSLALMQGHQGGVEISIDGEFLGSHVVGDQLDLEVLPRPLALINGVRHAMVSLAGPIAQAKAEGREFDIAEFMGDAEESGSDAAHVVHAAETLARHLQLGQAACLLVEDLVEATAGMLASPDVAAMADAVTQALVRRGRVGGDGLERILVRHPVANDLVTVPKELVKRWELNMSGVQE